ncbi:hypothetical protein GJR95_20890 [Spirosoma endbachense]|uniref:Dystroglycan-type cadherin-like domain-containing protein n=2 Tax=Spirosoma endbachense TaxID=2666025 RepID=A0A6P1VVS0_9BACT|nr:hypothetical protein GJR95_20890 [Spirosoma endbachense]
MLSLRGMAQFVNQGTLFVTTGTSLVTSEAFTNTGSVTNNGRMSFRANVTNNGSFNAAQGEGLLAGTASQTIAGSTSLTFGKLTLQNTAAGQSMVLAVPVTASQSLSLVDGILKTDATNLLTLNDNAQAVGASNASHVVGPIAKIGDEAFTFPLGNGTTYRPASISPQGTPTDAFTAQYVETSPSQSTSLAACLAVISDKEYWQIDHTSGSGSAQVGLAYQNVATSPSITSSPNLRVVRFNGSVWDPISCSANGGLAAGLVSTDGATAMFGQFTLGTQTPVPTISGLTANPITVCTGSPLTFTATLGNVTGTYTFTLTNGSSTTMGNASGTAFSQTVTATESSSQSFTLTVSVAGQSANSTASVTINALPIASLANNGPLTCALTSVTLTAGSGGSTYLFSAGVSQPNGPSSSTASVSQSGVYSVTVLSGSGCSSVASTTVTSNTALSAPTLQASASSTSNQPISVTATGCAGTVNWLPQGGTGQANGNIYTFTQPGNYTLTATCSVGNCTSPQAAPVSLQILPGGFAIQAVKMVNCTLIDEAKGGYQVQFTPQYSGSNGNQITFAVVNEKAATTEAPPYSLKLYTDNPVITLVANQAGSTEARYAYNWFASCQSGTDPNQQPTTSGIPNQTILVNQAYQLNLNNYFSDPDGQALTYSATGLPGGLSVSGSLISGTPSTTGVSSVQVTALDPGGLQVSSSFQLTVNPMPSTPAGFTIVGVSTVSCEVLSTGLRRVTFTPQYGGVDSSPISFSVVNEMPATTNPGPYSLNLYTDNPSITLSAKQGATTATFLYNWLSICTAPTRVGVAETGPGLQVNVLGNPVEGRTVDVEIRGVAGQAVQLNLVDMQGKLLHQQRLDEAGSVERVSVPIGTGKGLLLLQVNTTQEHRQVKLLKP